MSKVVFSAGHYEGMSVEDILDSDPAYILWAYSNLPDLGISTKDYDEARRRMDEWDGGVTDPYEDFYFAEEQAKAFGWSGVGDD